MQAKAYAAHNNHDPLKPYNFERRELKPNDVHIDILYCGVCHSDIHMVHDDWGMASYPLVPGHEIVGRVKAVGKEVSGFSQGDLVGVGCMVDSCRQCQPCKAHLEQHCERGMLMTYGSPDPDGADKITQGGYSSHIVVNKDFVLRISEELDIQGVAPLLCAGITTYSPLRQWDIKKGDKVGIIGLGGLGHMGVKIAAAMGAEVSMITTSASKAEDAKRLGANKILISTDDKQLEKHAGYFDFLMDTIPVQHSLDPYLPLLKLGKTLSVVGASPTDMHTMPLAFGRKVVAGSLIGGIQETQEMLDFCAQHKIVSDVEVIDIADINQAYTRVMKSDVKYRFVIDMASL
ncbi:NAD(P)-dependent alcohol dehydrogenase [Paraglaciecola aestuariivivens]